MTLRSPSFIPQKRKESPNKTVNLNTSHLSYILSPTSVGSPPSDIPEMTTPKGINHWPPVNSPFKTHYGSLKSPTMDFKLPPKSAFQQRGFQPKSWRHESFVKQFLIDQLSPKSIELRDKAQLDKIVNKTFKVSRMSVQNRGNKHFKHQGSIQHDVKTTEESSVA